MSLIKVRKLVTSEETVFHEGGPVATHPIRMGAALAVIENPYAGRYVEDLTPLMRDARALGSQLAQTLIDRLGRDNIEAYGKAAIVGVDGELEHGAIWHESGGWAMREALGDRAKAIVPAAKAVGATGLRLIVPMHHITAAYVRSHFSVMEIGVQDAPRPRELVLGLVMATGGRVHERLGGLRADQIKQNDGQR